MNIVRNINLKDITVNPYQPRTVFDQEKLNDLAKSLKEDGMIEPVVLRKVNGGYEIIAGERRCRAAELAGLQSVPAMIISADDSKSARLALIENIQREDLNAIEEAVAFSKLLEIEGCTQEELATRRGKSQSTSAKKMRLLHLNEDVTDVYRSLFAVEYAGFLTWSTAAGAIEVEFINSTLVISEIHGAQNTSDRIAFWTCPSAFRIVTKQAFIQFRPVIGHSVSIKSVCHGSLLSEQLISTMILSYFALILKNKESICA